MVPEVCNGLDDDCDGAIDDGVLITFYEDADGDSFGSTAGDAMTREACFRPEGFADDRTDCDDSDGDVHPAAAEVCDLGRVDENCDGISNPAERCTCSEGDPPMMCAMGGICAMGTVSCVGGSWSPCSIMPLAETCNGLDDDCDGLGDADEGLTRTCFADGDGDGYAASGAVPTERCPDPLRPTVGECPMDFTDRVPMGPDVDCDDTRRDARPGAAEVCSGTPPTVDEDCDGRLDEGLRIDCYADGDGDRFAVPGALMSTACMSAGCPAGTTSVVPAGLTTVDCMEGDPSFNPAAADNTCDCRDQDCDGRNDDAAPDGMRVNHYVDEDGDLYGRRVVRQCACDHSGGTIDRGGDCKDDPDDPVSPTVNPGVTAFSTSDFVEECIPSHGMPCPFPAFRSYDWNCDGTQERQPANTASCAPACSAGIVCGGGTGFVYTATPACGSLVPYRDCGTCSVCRAPGTADRAIGCR
jgi:hypothetical protein